MDWETSLLCLGLVLVSAFLLFIISTLGTRGQSYEEVVAENRRLAAQRGLLDDPVKQKRIQQQQSKKNKKAGKKVKEKQAKEQQAAANNSEHESEAPVDSGVEEEAVSHHNHPKGHVEFAQVTVATSEDLPKPQKNKKKSKDIKAKPILINKEDPSCISDVSSPPSPTILSQPINHFEQIHPKDEFERLLASTNDKNKKKIKDGKGKPILINKDDPSCVTDITASSFPDIGPVNNFEKIHPKDEFELLHASPSDNKEKTDLPAKLKEVKQSKSAKPVKKQEKEQQEKEKIVKPALETPVTAEPPKEQRKPKNKSNQPSIENEEILEKYEEPVITNSNTVSQPGDLTTDKILKQTYPLETPQTNVALNNVQAPQVKQVNSQNATQPAKSKKKKNELAQYQQLINCPEGVNVNLLVQLLGEAPLSRSEIQILTDCLLNKQNGPLPEHSEWSEGPKDPLIKLKKQLAEKEKAFAAEQEASQALQAKLKELRASLNAERTRCNQVSQAGEELASTLRSETAALQSRIQRGIDENNSLRQQVLQLQGKIAAETDWVAQRSQLDMHLQALSEKNTNLTANLGTLQNENAELQKNHKIAISELYEYKRQYEDENKRHSDMEQMLKQQLAQANERLQGFAEAQTEIQRLTSQNNERIQGFNEAQAEIQRLNSAHSQSQQQMLQIEKYREELDKQNQSLSAEMRQLQIEKSDLSRLVVEMKEKLDSQPTPNGTTSPDKSEAINIEKIVADARNELEEKHSQQLDSLQRQLDQHKDKNNELRTKNWKVMEALQAAEKKLQQLESQKTPEDNLIREAVTKACLEEQRCTKDVLERLFPHISVQGKTHKEWLENFTEQANADLLKISSANKEPQVAAAVSSSQTLVDNERLKELEIENHQLQCLVDKYKGVVVDTEKTLSRLQGHATEEEQKWKTQLAEKQRELDDLKQKILTMNEADSGVHNSGSLSTKVKNTNALGDMERLMEENNHLKELVDNLRNSSQSLNGPSQLHLKTSFNHTATKKRRTITGWLRRKITFRRKKNKEMRVVDRDKEQQQQQQQQQHGEKEIV